MKKYCYLLIAFIFCISSSFSQKHGLIVGGGIGNVTYQLQPSSKAQELLNMGGTGSTDYQFNGFLGYRYRVEPDRKPFFYDLDVYVGLKRFDYDYWYESYNNETNTGVYSGTNGEETYYYLALSPSFNYHIISGLNAGIGVEPTFYYRDENDPNFKFDIPLTAKIGYDFGLLEIAIAYKLGLCNTLKSDVFESGRLYDWQASVFIPF